MTKSNLDNFVKKINLDHLIITQEDLKNTYKQTEINKDPVIFKKTENMPSKLKTQEHIEFKDFNNYELFYKSALDHYSDKYNNDDDYTFITIDQILSPIKYLDYVKIGKKYIKNIQFYKYIEEPENNIIYFGEPDSKKTTRLISLFLSIATEKKQNNSYFEISKKMIYIIWDDLIDYHKWEKIVDYDYEYIFIDDIFNNMIMTDTCIKKFINFMRLADRNGSKIFMTTNCDKNLFIDNIKNLSNSFYSRFNETQFDFIECKIANNRRK